MPFSSSGERIGYATEATIRHVVVWNKKNIIVLVSA